MKNLIVICSLIASAFQVKAATTPMNVVEKSAYQLEALVNKKKIDSSFLTDVMTLQVSATAQGYTVVMQSPSGNGSQSNVLTLNFDPKGKSLDFNSNFVSASAQSPIFKSITASTILDLGAEAFVDHLSESADNMTVAQNVTTIQIQSLANGPLLAITLADGRVYKLQMDNSGKVISKGF